MMSYLYYVKLLYLETIFQWNNKSKKHVLILCHARAEVTHMVITFIIRKDWKLLYLSF